MNTRFFILGPLAAAVGLLACGGLSSAPPGGGANGMAVSPATLSGPVVNCEQGFAHPNVCCGAAPGQGAACETHPDAPFQRCESNAQTYPDPQQCCPLDGSLGACHAPVADAGAGSGSAGGTRSCTYACPPSFVQSGAACCPIAAQGAGASTACVPSPIADAVACPATPVCSCPEQLPDAGGTGGSGCDCATPPDCTAPPPPQCGPCPAGWQVPEGEPGLCCQETPSGDIACFSQAVPPPPPPLPIDAGAPTPGCVCSTPACPADAPCAAVVCDCDGGSAGSGEADAGASGCQSAADCTGALPSLAVLCSDGGYAAAHWACVDRVCALAFCQ